MDVDGGGSGGGGGGGGVHVVGVSLSFKGEPGKPIQIAYRGGVGGGGSFSILPARLRRQDFYLSVSRMKLCVSGRYCLSVCIFDLDHKKLAVSV